MEKLLITIRRQDNRSDESYIQQIEYEGELNISVITLLERINHRKEIWDIAGKRVEPILWSCSCLQGLCGSCAMLINGWPKLACKTFVNEEVMTKYFHKLTIEPLSKFPVVKDLKVDRSQIYDTMKQMSQWLESDAQISLDKVSFQYEMSSCLLCGICLEGCSNYIEEESFVGTPIAVSSAKLLEQEQDEDHKKKVKYNYKNNFYNSCVKSRVCEDICPMNIHTQKAISFMNKRFNKSFKK